MNSKLKKNYSQVCITGLFVNDEQVFVGKHQDQAFFTLDSDGIQCSPQRMKTKFITLQDGQVIASACRQEKGKNKMQTY